MWEMVELRLSVQARDPQGLGATGEWESLQVGKAQDWPVARKT